MDLGNIGDKAREAATNNRDKIEGGADRLIDSKIQAENADKAKAGVDKGLDSLLGEGHTGENVDAPAQPQE